MSRSSARMNQRTWQIARIFLCENVSYITKPAFLQATANLYQDCIISPGTCSQGDKHNINLCSLTLLFRLVSVCRRKKHLWVFPLFLQGVNFQSLKLLSLPGTTEVHRTPVLHEVWITTFS